MEGYGAPQYANVQYPWDGYQAVEIGEIPQEYNPVASYIKTFFVPTQMVGKRVFISFQGAESCIAVWLNGRYVGFSSDSFTPSEFELTDYLVEGENKLACRVERWSAGSWLEDQDFMRFSGIFRDVYLYAIPKAHIADIRVKTLLDDSFTDATLDLAMKMELDAAVGACRVKMALLDGGEVIAAAERVAEGEIAVQLPVKAPRLWSSEAPNLYDLLLTVEDGSGEVLGGRPPARRLPSVRAEKNAVMYLNGKRIVFKGANRHDFCAESGRAIPEEKIRRDLLTMKRNNINAVRTCHYPDSSVLYAICDELGLYVIDENNMETHGIWDMVARGRKPVEYALPGERMDWLPILLDRVNSTYQRDKNHASILIWSCGNESFGGDVIFEMSQKFHHLMTRASFITKAWRTTAAATRRPTWKARCIRRSRRSGNTSPSTASARSSSANTRTRWATRTARCTGTPNTPTRSRSIREALSGISSTSPSARRIATANDLRLRRRF